MVAARAGTPALCAELLLRPPAGCDAAAADLAAVAGAQTLACAE